ncbi:MAG: inositol monophosphatase family protein [Leptospirales bacterium]
MDYQAKMDKVIPLAEKAGAIIMGYLNKEKQIEYKGDIDLVTAADKESESYLFEALLVAFPEDGIQAEEGHTKASQSGYTWIVDPLDGTTSFAHSFPMFAVSIGLVDENRVPVLGVVYNPFYKELFSAYKNGGAFLNGAPIAVSKIESAEKALIGTGFPYTRRSHMEEILNRLGKILHIVHDIRRTGSAALDLSFVACGRLDGYYETGLKPWDVSAGIIIASEAGAMCTTFNGGQIDIDVEETLISNGMFHVELSKIIESI